MGTIGRIIVAVAFITIMAAAVQGAFMASDGESLQADNGPAYPPGADSAGISNHSLLLTHHSRVVMDHNVIRNTTDYVRKINWTTRVDRPDRQVFTRTDDGDPVDDLTYYVNGSDIGGETWGLEYSRIGYSEESYRDVSYDVAGYSAPDELREANTRHYQRSLQYGSWEFVSQRAIGGGMNLTTYNYTGLAPGVEFDDRTKTIDVARVTIRNDGLIVEYYERGNTSYDPYEKRVTTTVTDRDTVREPTWLETAEREDAQDDFNWHECGPNDIDQDDDGLCNEW